MVSFTNHLGPDVPLANGNHIIDVKTLSACAAYKVSNSTSFGNVTLLCQQDVNADYHRRAKHLDRRLHNTPANERGPFSRTLFEYGANANGRVLGPVSGVFGETSPDLHLLRDLCAHEMATKHVQYFRTTNAKASALFRHQLNRTWGHTIARGWSRLILDRLRDYTDLQNNAAPNSSDINDYNFEANEHFAFHNPVNYSSWRDNP